MTNIIRSISLYFAISVVLLGAASISTSAQGQVPLSSKDVNVVNTPTVSIAPGATVGISSASNTVRLDPTVPIAVRAEGSVLVYDEVISIPGTNGPSPIVSTNPVNVSAFNRIRVAVVHVPPTALCVTVSMRMRMDGGGIAADFFLEDYLVIDQQTPGTRVYDLPGPWINFRIDPDGCTDFGSNVRIQVYGRR